MPKRKMLLKLLEHLSQINELLRNAENTQIYITFTKRNIINKSFMMNEGENRQDKSTIFFYIL